ncbi:MAG: IS200/IS605 family transposase [Bacteroidales bacterium]
MKPGTFTQMYVQLIFAVNKRENVLNKNIRPRIFEYISGILNNIGHKTIAINGVYDHIHILIGMNPSKSISDTVHDVKRGSSLFINENKLLPGRFSWQEGYGGFTYSKSQIDKVYKYIINQEVHHLKKPFQDEYATLLKEHGVEYDPRFLFEFYDVIP